MTDASEVLARATDAMLTDKSMDPMDGLLAALRSLEADGWITIPNNPSAGLMAGADRTLVAGYRHLMRTMPRITGAKR